MPGLPSLPGQAQPVPPRPGPGASSTFGTDLPRNPTQADVIKDTGQGTKPPPVPEQTFTAPGLYGAGQQTFTAGQGRFTRPRYRYRVSASMGFDDNVLQSNENPRNIPDQVITQVIPAEPEISTIETTRSFTIQPAPGGTFVPVFRTTQRKVILRPAVPERTVETVIPGFQAPEKQASVVSSLSANVDVQWVKSRSLFTLDLQAGLEYYWNRDSNPLDYNGSLSATYIRRLTSRAQLTSNVSISHQTAPDYSQVNLITSGISAGDSYTAGNLKLDLSYRWASRFTTVSSIGYSGIIYEGTRSGNSYSGFSLGNEFRYLWSRRYSYIAEVRYGTLKYLETDIGNSSDLLLLLGVDYRLSQRITATLRVGEALRTFEAGGDLSTSPYGELAVTYLLDRKNQFSLSGRYGFEQGSNPGQRNITTRLSAGYTRVFTPRFSSSLNLNYIENSYGNEDDAIPQSVSTTYDVGLSAQYIFNRHFSLSARYSWTDQFSDDGFSDIIRGRFFLTGQYEF